MRRQPLVKRGRKAGILAARMIGMTDQEVQRKLEVYEQSLVEKVEAMQDDLQ